MDVVDLPLEQIIPYARAAAWIAGADRWSEARLGRSGSPARDLGTGHG